MEKIIVRLINDLPVTVHGITVVDAEGDYNIYLNAKRGDIKKAFLHELNHIKHNDFYTSDHIEQIELRARRTK